ncbi:Sphingosine 1-Phosphate Receptor 1 [Manis pentadactyla]|nr:Sphingosine 1-Phosphate Receptor 1 [Manis pentadactyla]
MGSTSIPLVKALRSSVSDYVNYDIIVRHYNYTGKLNISTDKENGIKLTLGGVHSYLLLYHSREHLCLADHLENEEVPPSHPPSHSHRAPHHHAENETPQWEQQLPLLPADQCLLGHLPVLGGLPIMGWNCISVLPSCSTVLPLYHKHYILFCTTVFTLLLLSIVILYCRIYSLVRTRSRRLTFRKNMSKASRSSEKSLALLKTVIIVLSVFIACWAPLFILLLLDVGCKVKTCDILFRAEYFLVLAVLNSGTNPIIYTLTSKEMRRAFIRIISCCKCPSGDSTGKFKRPIIAGMEFSRMQSSPYTACISQLFVFHLLASVDCHFLTAMAYDHHLAICQPLTYSTRMSCEVQGALVGICCAISFINALDSHSGCVRA